MTVEEELTGFNAEMKDYIVDLLNTASEVNKKTKSYSNVVLTINQKDFFLKVDDHQLFYIGAVLLPNVMNYLVNILPQLIYPYVVAYLQDLSNMREDPITVSEFYNCLNDELWVFSQASPSLKSNEVSSENQ